MFVTLHVVEVERSAVGTNSINSPRRHCTHTLNVDGLFDGPCVVIGGDRRPDYL